VAAASAITRTTHPIFPSLGSRTWSSPLDSQKPRTVAARPSKRIAGPRFAPVPFQVTSSRFVVSQHREILGHDSETHLWLNESCR
jgi:hypothetical protein